MAQPTEQSENQLDYGLVTTLVAELPVEQGSMLWQSLSQECTHYSLLLHKLLAKKAKDEKCTVSLKQKFCAEEHITSRQFNALSTDLDGRISSIRELQKEDLKLVNKSIQNLRNQLKAKQAKLKEVKGKTLVVSAKKLKALKTKIRKLADKLVKAKNKEKRLKIEKQRTVPSLCFGTNDLFRKQFHLAVSGYRSHAEWKQDWEAHRNHQAYYLGSKDESFGNQLFQLHPQADGTFIAHIRKSEVTASGKRAQSEDYIVIRGINFGYQAYLLHGILCSHLLDKKNTLARAVSYRVHRENGKFYLHAMFTVPPVKVGKFPLNKGVVGIDFNADNLTASETDAKGNLVKTQIYAYPNNWEKLSSGQRLNVLSLHLKAIVAWARRQGKPVAIEDLDFTAKKRQAKSAGSNRMLHGLAYRVFTYLAEAKCFRAGLDCLKVNPAYTSFKGRVKYQDKYGITVHSAAALVIARQAQGFKEKYPKKSKIKGKTSTTFQLPARNAEESHAQAWKQASTEYKGFLVAEYRETRRRLKSEPLQQLQGAPCLKSGRTCFAGKAT